MSPPPSYIISAQLTFSIIFSLFDFNSDIYGQKLKVEFIEYLRDERKYSSLDELKAAISEDALRARKIVECLEKAEGCGEGLEK